MIFPDDLQKYYNDFLEHFPDGTDIIIVVHDIENGSLLMNTTFDDNGARAAFRHLLQTEGKDYYV
jgi:hypothetical protein